MLPTGTTVPRILHLTSSAHIGGTERMLLRFFERCDRGRFEHEVAAMEPAGDLLERSSAMGIEAHGLSSQSPWNAATRGELAALLRERKFALVHAYGLRADILGRGLAHAAGVPAFVSAIRNTDPWRRFYHVWLDRWTARGARVSLYISNSEAGRQSRIAREKVDPGKIVVIYNGIEVGSMAQWDRATQGDAAGGSRATQEERLTGEGARATQDRSAIQASDGAKKAEILAPYGIKMSDGPLIAVVSNLRPQKGHLDLAAIVPELRREFPRVRVLFIGRDESGGAIERKCREWGVAEHVAFCGFVPNPLPLVHVSDVFCLPSYWEGLPTAVLEAMGAGKAIVSTFAGGIPELVRDGEEALLVRPGDREALREALARVMRDKALAERLGKAARERAVREFSVEVMTKRIEEEYGRLITNYK